MQILVRFVILNLFQDDDRINGTAPFVYFVFPITPALHTHLPGVTMFC